ncbi:MAG: hypothetical protein JWO78_1919 [Micavibrio sp.]|nr:hypothetical protein [Micavibrio sp.]
MAKWWESLFKGSEEAGKIGVKIAGKSAAQISKEAAEAAKSAERIEPTLGTANGAAAATPKPKIDSQQYLKELAERRAKEAADAAALEKSKPLEFQAGSPSGSGIQKTFDPRSGAAAKAADPAADAAKAAAVPPTVPKEPMGWITARNIGHNNGTNLNRKLEALVDQGPNAEAWINRAVAKARNRGITEAERDAIKDSTILKEKAPELREKLLQYYDNRHPVNPGILGVKGWISRVKESIAAPLDYWRHYPTNAAGSFIGNTPGRAIGAVAVTAKVASVVPAVATVAFAADAGVRAYSASNSTDPNVSSNALMTGAAGATRDAGSALGAVARGTGHALSVLPFGWAQKKAKELIDDAPKVAGAVLEGADQITRGVARGATDSYEEQVNGKKTTDTDKKKEGNDMGLIGTLSDANKVRKAAEEKLARDKANKPDETGAPGPATAAPAPAAPAAAAGSNPAPQNGSEKTEAGKADEPELTDEAKEAVAKMNPDEKLKFLKDKGEGAFKKAKDKVEEFDFKKFAEENKHKPGALLGAFSAFDKNKGLLENGRNVGIMAVLGQLLWETFVPMIMNFFGGGGRGGNARYNRNMAQGQMAYADMSSNMGPNARFTPNGVRIDGPAGASAPSGEARYTAQGVRINGNQQASAEPRSAAPAGGIDQGNGVITYPVAPQPSSVAKSIDGNAIQTSVDPKKAADDAAYEDLIKKVNNDHNWANKKVADVQVKGIERSYGAETPAPAQTASAAPVTVNGIEREYGAPAATVVAANAPKPKQRELEYAPSNA